MSFIFESVADAAILFTLTLMCFADLYGGGFRHKYWSKENTWFQATAKRIPGMAPWWLFSSIWFVVLVLVITALFLFYRGNSDFGTTFDAVTLLFLFNIVLCKAWMPLFFGWRMAGAALVDLMLCLFTAIGILFLFGWSNWWTQFWIFLWYPVWLLYPCYLNVAWLYYEKPLKSPKLPGDACSTNALL